MHIAQDNLVTFFNSNDVKYLPPHVYDIEVGLKFCYIYILNIILMKLVNIVKIYGK